MTPAGDPVFQLSPCANRPVHPVCVPTATAPDTPAIGRVPPLHEHHIRDVAGRLDVFHVASIGRTVREEQRRSSSNSPSDPQPEPYDPDGLITAACNDPCPWNDAQDGYKC